MQRILRNVVRLPGRMARTVRRRMDLVYRIQRAADRAVPRTFDRRRLEQLEAIPGNSSARECRLLAHLIAQAPAEGCIVEIGALCGKSTAWAVEAAEHLPHRPPVVSIDPHVDGTWDAFNSTVERFRLRERGLEIRRAASHEVGVDWDRPVSVLWIDGSHEYADVVADIEDFTPHVVPGGWVVFDDASGSQFPGVKQAIDERMRPRPGFREIGMIKNFALFRRDGGAQNRRRKAG